MALVLWKELSPAPAAAAAVIGGAPAAVETTNATAEETKGPDTVWVIAAYGLVVGSAALAWLLYKLIDPAAPVVAPGLSALAPIYILAQGIERLLEPFSKLLGSTTDDAGARTSKEQARTQRDAAFATLVTSPSSELAVAAASAQAVLERIRRNTVVIAWALATGIAMFACGAFGIRLLTTLGFDAPAFWDIAITGLAVGSGTKPLHDLISNLQKARDGRSNPPGVSTID
jgi:hypothetical protein